MKQQMILNNIVPVIRQTKQLLDGIEIKYFENFTNNFFGNKYGIDINHMIDNKIYDVLLNTFMYIFRIEITDIITSAFKDKTTGIVDEIIKNITECTDYYKILPIVKKLFDDVNTLIY